MVAAIPANRYGDDFADSQAGHPGIKRSRYEMLQIGTKSKYLAGKIRGEDFADQEEVGGGWNLKYTMNVSLYSAFTRNLCCQIIRCEDFADRTGVEGGEPLASKRVWDSEPLDHYECAPQ